MLRNFPQARRLLRRMGFEKEDAYFWKQMGKATLCTYTLFGVAWLWNETSLLGWWTLKPRPKMLIKGETLYSNVNNPCYDIEMWLYLGILPIFAYCSCFDF